jgi:hypothetical protein
MTIDPNSCNGNGKDDDGILEAAQPFGAGGEPLHAPDEATSAPRSLSLCGRSPWHPTHAVLTNKVTGSNYVWNSRAHRKLRFPESALGGDGTHHPRHACQRLRLASWEPHIVTWYNCWIGIVANTMWVVNGLYATWPDQASTADPTLISYGTGVFGAFLFIVCGYLGFVEAINHTFAPVEFPVSSSGSGRSTEGRTRYLLPPSGFGRHRSPIGFVSERRQKVKLRELLDAGHPVVEDVKTKHQITAPVLDTFVQRRMARLGADDGELGGAAPRAKAEKEAVEAAIVGRKLSIRVGRHVFVATVDSWDSVAEEKRTTKSSSYSWWTWTPDLAYIGIFNAVVFFVSTIIFFIPACAWLPMARKGASVAATVFWVYVLQVTCCPKHALYVKM